MSSERYDVQRGTGEQKDQLHVLDMSGGAPGAILLTYRLPKDGSEVFARHAAEQVTVHLETIDRDREMISLANERIAKAWQLIGRNQSQYYSNHM